MRKFNIKVNGTQYEVEVEEVWENSSRAKQYVDEMAQRSVPVSASFAAKESTTNTGNSISGEAKPITAPMPGKILKINVNCGDRVKKGHILLILEAMKMENEIVAPADGIVSSVNLEKDKDVMAGDALLYLIYD